MKLFRLSFLALVLFSLGLPAVSQGADESALKQSMLERVTKIDELKEAGAVGENNKGFLEQRAALTPDQTETLNAENADRRELYGILASRLGLTTTVVGEGRAESVRKKSAKGVWVQAPDGSWFQK